MAAFFYDDSTRSKLTVMYFINSLHIELTRDQIAAFSTEHDLVPYFDLQSTVCELEEAGFIAAVPRVFGQAYMLTEDGKRTLEMFKERIPQSQRDDLDTYADECRETLRLQTQYSGVIEKVMMGGYIVKLRAMESSRTLLDIELLLPDSKSANKAVKEWPAKAEAVYKFLIENLAQ